MKLKYVIRCTIWYDWYNLKNVKNTNVGASFLAKLHANTPPWVFSRFLNFTNGFKSSEIITIFSQCHISRTWMAKGKKKGKKNNQKRESEK